MILRDEGAELQSEKEIRMSIRARLAEMVVIVGALCASAAVTLWAHENSAEQQARTAIERLHQQDVEATLSGKADDFAKLWDNEAVRLGRGGPAEIGKTSIYADDKREEANGNGGQSFCYKPEIKDLQIVGDWAFEWGYFSYKESANAKPGRGKVLRILKRQPDGSWKFTHVMSFTEELASAAPMSHPCE
jgi:ketosteroid isomerase-like protein